MIINYLHVKCNLQNNGKLSLLLQNVSILDLLKSDRMLYLEFYNKCLHLINLSKNAIKNQQTCFLY
jgi:hypothetical protein